VSCFAFTDGSELGKSRFRFSFFPWSVYVEPL
jgi:hypothetical protein